MATISRPGMSRSDENQEWIKDRIFVLGRLQMWEKLGMAVNGELLHSCGTVKIVSTRLVRSPRGEIQLGTTRESCRLMFEEPHSPAAGYFEAAGEAVNIWFGDCKLTVWPTSGSAPIIPGQTDALEVQMVN